MNIENNNMVSNALVTGVDSATGVQNIEDDSSMFEIDSEDDDRYRFNVDEILALTHQQEPPILPQDTIPPLQDQASRFTRRQGMKEYADELENMLEEEDDDGDDDDDDDKATQQNHPQDQDSCGINNPLVIMEMSVLAKIWSLILWTKKTASLTTTTATKTSNDGSFR